MSEHASASAKVVNPSLQKPTAVYLFAGYFFWPFSLIGLAIEKEDDFIRFHCAQGLAFMFLQIILSVLISFFSLIVWFIIPIFFMVILIMAMVASYVLYVIAIFKAAKGEKYHILWIGDFAEKVIQKWLLKF